MLARTDGSSVPGDARAISHHDGPKTSKSSEIDATGAFARWEFAGMLRVTMRYRFEQWELDWDNRELRHGATPVHVTPKVLQLLHVMLACHGRLVTRGELQKQLWPDVTVGQDALIRIVKESRKVIMDDGDEPRLLVNRRGHGYVFTGHVDVYSDSDVVSSRRTTRGTRKEQVVRPLDDTTAIERDKSATVLVIQWLMPCRRITVIRGSAPTVLGRSAKCDEVLDGTGVSREHAVCTHQGPIAVLRDLASRNGTYLNGRWVGQTPLAANDVIRLGGWLGVVKSVPTPEEARFDQLARDFHGGHETRRLLQLATPALARGRVANLWGEPGTGKSALVSVLHEMLRPGRALVTVQCSGNGHGEAQKGKRVTIPFDGSVSNDTIRERARRGTLVLDNVDALPHERTAAFNDLVSSCSPNAPELPQMITTSRAAVPELVASACAARPAILALMGVELALDPLRRRRGDILDLGEVFWGTVCDSAPPQWSPRAAECLLLHSWTKNVLELKGVMLELAGIPNPDRKIDVHDLPPMFARSAGSYSHQPLSDSL